MAPNQYVPCHTQFSRGSRPQVQSYASNSGGAYTQSNSVAGASAFPEHLHAITPPVASRTMPASATFDPQLRTLNQFAQSYVPSGLPQPQPGLFNPQEQETSQDGYFRFHLPEEGEEGEEQEEEREEDSDEEEENSQQGTQGKGKGRLGGAREPGACEACKQSKVRCVFPNPGAKCRRCARGGHDCHVPGRRPKARPPSHAELQARLHEKDRVIYSLLAPPGVIHAFPAAALSNGPILPEAAGHTGSQSDQSTNSHWVIEKRDLQATGIFPALPVWDKRMPKREVERRVDAWIKETRGRIMQSAGRVASAVASAGASGDIKDAKDNGADTPNPKRWRIPGEPPDYSGMPDILTRKIVTHQEVDKLFEVFFDKINIVFSICDPVIHTPGRVLKTSPFLYTTICAIASRYYAPRPDLYMQLLDSAKRAAGAALNGVKSIETCQAYLLLGVYHPPSRTFLEDRTFLYLGLAIRLATDLELYLPPQAQPLDEPRTEERERELLNRARVWLNCFCNDRSISTQLGKPSVILIPAHKGIPFDLKCWWRSSGYNGPHDIHVCAYASLLQVVSGFHVYSDAYSADGVKKKLDLKLVQSYSDDITAVGEDWTRLLAKNFAECGLSPVLIWRDNLWPFLVSYAKLVVLSIGLQHGLRQGLRHDNPFSDQCIDAASDILTCIIDKLANLGYLRYCVEAHFVFTGFAAAFLLKILRPKFLFMMRGGREQDIIQLVQRLIDLFGSDEVAINSRHTPKLYSRFLADVLAKHIHAKTTVDPQIPQASIAKAENRDPSTPVAMDVGPGFAFPSTQLGHPSMESVGPSASMLEDGAWEHDVFYGSSSYMDVDKPLVMGDQITQDDMMLASMAPITDPRFWEQGTMPGFSWMTDAQTWPMAVDGTATPHAPSVNIPHQHFTESAGGVHPGWESPNSSPFSTNQNESHQSRVGSSNISSDISTSSMVITQNRDHAPRQLGSNSTSAPGGYTY